MDLSEKETRNEIIDPILDMVGWKKKYIKEEVNSIKSNFKTKEFKFFDNCFSSKNSPLLPSMLKK